MWEGAESIDVAASPERVWAIVTDVERHPNLAGSGEIRSINVDGPLAVGTQWDAQIGVPGVDEPFTAESHVLSLDEPTEFTWTSIPLVDDNPDERPLVTWSFIIAPSNGGCTVEHTCRVDGPKVGADEFKVFFMETLNRPPTILAGMRKTLENVKSLAERPGS
jgi:uncharacterized protein YndB with AHSA1/START domain